MKSIIATLISLDKRQEHETGLSSQYNYDIWTSRIFATITPLNLHIRMHVLKSVADSQVKSLQMH
jgi:hypothetical protein